ncbi:peptidase inhibitor family I36 protein [Streptomyces sp. NPDC003015]
MVNRKTRRIVAATAAGGAALFACTAMAPSASAATDSGVSFFSGKNLTGTRTVADLNASGCQNLSQPALSAMNVSASNVYVYYNANCQPGMPGAAGDSYFALGSLHAGQFPYAAVSYRVVTGS